MERNTKVVIFGVSQLASLAHFYLNHDSPYEVVGFTVDQDYMPEGSKFEGLPVVPFEEVEKHYSPVEFRMFLPISFKRMSHLRREKFEAAKGKGYSCISYVSTKATTWPDLTIGENCFIFEDNTIQPYVTIGDNCVLWSGNHIGHHTNIGSHVFMTSHVVISGACEIGDHSFFGVNSTVRDETVVAPETLIGMGAILTKDSHEGEIWLAAKSRLREAKSNQLDSISHKTGG